MFKVSGLWLNKTKDGNETFMSGSIGPVRVVILKNTFKEEGSNQPDYNLFFAEAVKKEQVSDETKTFDEDIPF